MREKVAWAKERGLTPPERAVILASYEAEPPHEAPEQTQSADSSSRKNSCCDTEEKQQSTTQSESCCKKKKSTASIHTEQAASTSTNKSGKSESKTDRANWVAMLFAQTCHGDGPGALGLLNIGLPPTVPAPWMCELVLAGKWIPLNQLPIRQTSAPLVPPPRA